MTTPSILSAIQKLRALLTKEEKLKWVGLVGFALGTSFLEVLTASAIIVFAQVLTQPEAGLKYLVMLGLKPNLPPVHIVLYAAITVGVIYLIKNLVAACEVFYQNFSIQKMNYDFKNKLLNRYAGVDYGFYLTRNFSLNVQIIRDDAELIFSSTMISLACILSETAILFCLVSLVVYINPPLAIAIFSFGAVIGAIVVKVLLPQFYRFGVKAQDATLYTSQNLLQFFSGLKEIVLLGKRDAFIRAYQYYSYKKTRIQALQSAINCMPRVVIEVLFVGGMVGVIGFLCIKHESPMQMIGILGGYVYAGFRLMPGLNRIIGQLNLFKAGIPSIERVYNEYHVVSAKDNYSDVPGFQFQNEICLKDVSFRYLNTENDALKHIDFKIKKGECIGIVGETGSGKSTLVDVILGLLKPYVGSILVDGKFPAHAYQWHQKIGYVPQSVYLTDDTIEANIAFGEQNIDLIRLNAAIDAAQLRNFINHAPQGAKTLVGERGVRLAGGERQRIAIARVLYRNPEVLIFDEATSALDNETEARLMETIYKVSQDRTVIMIAHRLTTLKNCDRIIMMEDGKVKDIIPYDLLNH